MPDQKTECGYVEENAEEPCNFMLTEDERPQHMFHVHGIPSATIVHEKEPDAPIFGEDVPKSVRNAQAMMKKREEAQKKWGPQSKPLTTINSATEPVDEELEQIPQETEQTEQYNEQKEPEIEQNDVQSEHKRKGGRIPNPNNPPCPDCGGTSAKKGAKDKPLYYCASCKKHFTYHGNVAPKQILKPTNENIISTSLKCPRCSSTEGFQKWGNKNGAQLWNCKKCKKKFIADTNEDREVPVKDKHLETIRKSYEKQKARLSKKKGYYPCGYDGCTTLIANPAKKKHMREVHGIGGNKVHKVSDEIVHKNETKSYEKEDASLVDLLLKESQTAHKALDVLLPMIIGTGNSAYLIAALAELHDLRQEKKNGGLKA
jgi:transposase-like protein